MAKLNKFKSLCKQLCRKKFKLKNLNLDFSRNENDFYVRKCINK